MNSGRVGEGGNWLQPRVEAQGAVRYLDTFRERWWLVVSVTIIALAAASVYVATAPKRYQAEADMLITPVAGGESSTSGLGLITETNDPTQTVSTAAKLVSTYAVATETKRRLGLSESPQALLNDIKAEPI